MVEAKTEIEVGGTLESFLAKAGDRWEAAVAGEDVTPTSRIVYRDWNALASALTTKRMEVLRTLHEAPADGVRALARVLARDVKRVHGDVAALEDVGLIVRDDEGRLSVPFDEVKSTISFRSAITARGASRHPPRPASRRSATKKRPTSPSGIDM